MVDPVVVIPDIDSKKASVKDNSKSEKIKGNDPKKAINTQLKVVRRNACFNEILKLSDLLKLGSNPLNIFIYNKLLSTYYEQDVQIKHSR